MANDDGTIQAANANPRPPEPSLPPSVAQAPSFRDVDYGAQARKEAARKNILIGSLLLVGGLVLTVVTYSAASSGGGTYVLAWGPIIFGGIRLIRGLTQA